MARPPVTGSRLPLIWPALTCALLGASPPAALASAPGSTATLYAGGDILTMVGPSPRYVEALVEKGGRIV